MVETTMPADTNVSPETERQQQSTSSKEPAPVPAHESQSESQSQSQTQTQPQPEQQPEPLKPGPRASRLHQVYSKALQATLRANSYANFSACFPTPAQHASRSLESVWRQLNTKLEQSAQAEFDDILKERDVVRGLNELDRLIADAKVRRDVEGAGGSRVPPHTLPPDELYKAHLAPYLIKTKEKLDEQINAVETQNIALSQTIIRQRQQIQHLFVGLDSLVDDLEAAAKATAQFSQDAKLREEAEDVHAQNRAMSPL